MGRIPQQQLTKFERGLRADNRTLEPATDEDRQITAVIDVGVGKKHGPDLGSIEGEFLPVPLPELPRPLKQTAIDESLRPSIGKQVTRPRDGARGPAKFEFHISVSP
jgi:hypothetical protein